MPISSGWPSSCLACHEGFNEAESTLDPEPITIAVDTATIGFFDADSLGELTMADRLNHTAQEWGCMACTRADGFYDLYTFRDASGEVVAVDIAFTD